MLPLLQLILVHFYYPRKKPCTPYLSPTNSLIPQPQAITSLLSLTDLPILDTSHKWNHVICGLCGWLLSLCIFSRLWHISVVQSFLLVNSIPLHGYATFCIFTTQWTFGLFSPFVYQNNALTILYRIFCMRKNKKLVF